MSDMMVLSQFMGFVFNIPSHQRGYRWQKENVVALLNDIKEFIDQGNPDMNEARVYCLQPLAVTAVEGKNNHYVVEDGQQRLTTFFLLWKYLFPDIDPYYSFDFESDENNKRHNYITTEVLNENYKTQTDINFYHMGWAFQSIKEWFLSKDNGLGYEERFRAYLTNPPEKDSLQFIWYQVDANKARKVFRDLNYGKIRLTSSDLIKALLLSEDNPQISAEQRIQIGQQLEEMEVMVNNNRFWFMYQHREPIFHADRMDFIFNLAENIKENDYKYRPYAAFECFAKAGKKGELFKEWKKSRDIYLILQDLYEDPFYYHYIGFLVNRTKSFTIKEWLDLYKKETKNNFLHELVKKIQNVIPQQQLSKFSYEANSREEIRSILMLHNIETILQRYLELKKQFEVQFTFEQFPFDLIHEQNWDIEHMASQTDNPLDNKRDWDAWCESTKEDFAELFIEEEKDDLGQIVNKETEELRLLKAYKTEPNKKTFSALRKQVLVSIDNRLDDEKVINKHGLGNLVLLDSHTNRSFHNSLYPKKRRDVIAAKTYIPVCTRQAFMKHYNSGKKIMMNSWTQSDYNGYLADMETKLAKFLPEIKNEKDQPINEKTE